MSHPYGSDLGVALHLAVVALTAGVYLGEALTLKRHRVEAPPNAFRSLMVLLLVAQAVVVWEGAGKRGWVAFSPHDRPLLGLLLLTPLIIGCVFLIARMLRAGPSEAEMEIPCEP